MKKEEIRKEYFNLRIKGHSQNQCKKIIFSTFEFEVSKRTLQRWTKKLNETEWDLKDKSKRPTTIHYKINSETENKIILIKKQTGWGAEKIENFVDASHTSINKILRKYNLTELNKRKKKRIKYIRWQRKHPNSLWQIDHSDQKIDDKYVISVVDDCSRKSLAFIPVNQVTTDIVIELIDKLIKIYGKPKQILTDNGGAYGLKSKDSRFDRKLRKEILNIFEELSIVRQRKGKLRDYFKHLRESLNFVMETLNFGE